MITVNVKVNTGPDMATAVRNLMVSTLDRIGGVARRVAIQEAPKDTGALINSIHLVRDYRPPEFTGGISTNMPHAVVMEFGRRPGQFPPFIPIYRWVLRHARLFPPRAGDRGRSEKSRLKGVAFAVARKIAREGIPSNPAVADHRNFFKKAEDAIRAQFSQEIQALGLSIQRAWQGGE